MSKTGKEILEASTVIAVVGASRDPYKAGGSVPAGLQQRGFRIIPINPHADTLFGERVYRSLAEVPEKIDLVDVFRPAADAPADRGGGRTRLRRGRVHRGHDSPLPNHKEGRGLTFPCI